MPSVPGANWLIELRRTSEHILEVLDVGRIPCGYILIKSGGTLEHVGHIRC